jgi:hypothetical protein
MAYTYQQRVRAIPVPIRAVIALLGALPGLALGGYWWWSYSGLYRWLAEMQIDWFGAYLPGATGMVEIALCVAAGFLPAALLLFVLVQLGVFPVDPENLPDVAAQDVRTNRWLNTHYWRVAGVAAGIVMLVGGALLTTAGLRAGALSKPDLAVLETGAAPASRYVRVSGRLLREKALQQSMRNSPGGTLFVPLVCPGWQAGRPAALYVRVVDPKDPRLAEDVFQGTLAENGLPGPIRTVFEQSGPRPTSPHYVLELGNRPSRDIDNGLGLLGVGGALLALTAVAWGIIAYRERRRRGIS